MMFSTGDTVRVRNLEHTYTVVGANPYVKRGGIDCCYYFVVRRGGGSNNLVEAFDQDALVPA